MEIDPQILAGVRQGQLLAGKYLVERILGVGGMGVVVAARHTELGNRVALKFLLPAMVSNPDAVFRFIREARAAVRIQNEHVARVSDIGTLDNGAPYIVMEFLEGRDLSTWLDEQGPLSVEQTVDFVLQACVAVADAHSLGIIHRDLKPANFFCIRRSDGQFVIKVLDFGISKLLDADPSSEAPGASVTQTTTVMGSPLYMSPEQMRSAKDVDARTDIWALGIILFQLLTGRAPFHGNTIAEVAVQVGSDPPPPLRHFRQDVPKGLEAVILRCLEKERSNRYPNVAQLALALSPFAPERARGLVRRITGILRTADLSSSTLATPPSGPPLGEPACEETLAAPGTVSPWSESRPVASGRKAVALTLTVVALLGAVSGAVILRRASIATPQSDLRLRPDPFVGAAEAIPMVASPTAGPERSSFETPAAATTAPEAEVVNPARVHRSPVPLPAIKSPRSPAGSVSRLLAVAPDASIMQGPGGASVPATRTTSGAPPRPDCEPPYTLDDEGQKHFKPECYR